MTDVWIGGYVRFNSETQSEDLLPLLECLRYASELGGVSDKYFKGIFGEDGVGGGDPGWSLHWIISAQDALYPEGWRVAWSR